MAKGLFDNKLIASAKLSFMEKYGFTYNVDLGIIEKYMDNVIVEHIGEGKVKIIEDGRSFEVFVRDYQAPIKDKGKIEGHKDRKGKWISIWDIEHH